MVYVGGAKNENGGLINLTYNLINKYEHLGIGYPDETQSRLEHHTKGTRFPSLKNRREVVYHQTA